jgi:hypothetical protein
VKSSRGKDKLLLEGYSYRRANNSQNIWRCSRNNCAGRVKSDGSEYITITEHVHTPNPDENISTEFKSQICTKAAICHDPPRRIIHEALLNIDQADGAAVPTYYSSQRTIERKRKKNDIPLPRPQTFSEILIPDELQITNSGARFLLYDNHHPNRRLIILSSDDDLDRLSNSDHWHCDGTFKVCNISLLKLIFFFFCRCPLNFLLNYIHFMVHYSVNLYQWFIVIHLTKMKTFTTNCLIFC